DAMARAARLLEGRHDFAAFQGTGSSTSETERQVFRSTVSPTSSGSSPLIVYEISGDGFLRHMVRIIVGTLVEIGRGRRRTAWIGDVLASQDRTAAGPTAPPEGLFLVGVEYP